MCKKIYDNNIMESEGLYTTIWGPVQWESMHNITFNYPHNPTEKQKEDYQIYFMSLCNVLPCCKCREHYTENINKGELKLTKKHLKNRDTLTLWLYNFHKSVCERLGFKYDITYEMMCDKYNSFISSKPVNEMGKVEAYRNMYNQHACVIPKEKLLIFANYAEERGFGKRQFINNVNYYSGLDRESEDWYERNQKCQSEIKFMRLNGIESLETSGKYENLPTFNELILLSMCTSRLPIQNLDIVIDIITGKIKNKNKKPKSKTRTKSKDRIKR